MKASFECEKGAHFEGRGNVARVNWSKFETQVKRVWIIKTCKGTQPLLYKSKLRVAQMGDPKSSFPLAHAVRVPGRKETRE